MTDPLKRDLKHTTPLRWCSERHCRRNRLPIFSGTRRLPFSRYPTGIAHEVPVDSHAALKICDTHTATSRRPRDALCHRQRIGGTATHNNRDVQTKHKHSTNNHQITVEYPHNYGAYVHAQDRYSTQCRHLWTCAIGHRKRDLACR